VVPLMIQISSACTGCGACLGSCPHGALRPAPRRPAWRAERCQEERECVEVCPAGAILALALAGGS